MNTREDRFSKKMMETPPSAIRKFFDLVIGRDDIITLGVGEPDFATPWVNNIPTYSAWWVLSLCDYCTFTQDKAYFCESLPFAREIFSNSRSLLFGDSIRTFHIQKYSSSTAIYLATTGVCKYIIAFI